MRLVSYNILEGLQPMAPVAMERRAIDRDRAAKIRRVITDLDPDFLVLNEALFCRQYAGKAIDYGDLFGFPHQSASLYDDAWGNAILSHHPIIKSREMRIYNRGGVIAEIDSSAGRLTIASYHPHPRRYPENKAQDFENLVADVMGPLIVCGDLNCISPEDHYDRNGLIAAFRAFSSTPEASVDLFIESGKLVFGALNKLGLRDAIPRNGRRYSMPTDLINTDKSSAIRIDHVLANDGIQIVGGEVFHSRDTNQASDHHPVILDFRIKPPSP